MKTFREKHPHGDQLFPFELFDQEAIKGTQVCYLHWHDEVEWLYINKGSIDLYIDGVLFVVEQGQMIAIEPGLLHYIIARSDCHYMTCVFHKKLLQFAYEDFISLQYIDPYVNNDLSIKNPIDIQNSVIQENFLNIVYVYHSQLIGYQLKIKLLLLDIFNTIIEKELLIPNNHRKHNLESIEIVLGYIQDNYYEKITSLQLAEMVNYNPQYFSRFFKESTGYTPIEYINRYRIEIASKELMNPELSILEISGDCGFDSCSYFIKKFKEIKQVSPSLYRKRLLSSFNEGKTY